MDANLAGALRTLAWYNRRANEALGDILASQSQLVQEEGTTWYGSILDLLSHVVISDTAWLNRFWIDRLEKPDRLDLAPASLSDSLFESLSAWRGHRSALDADLERFCSALSPEELAATVSYANSRGEPHAQPRWQLMLHMFNHQTHHRGAIAGVLDARGVENDVSNLVWYLRREGGS